MQEKFYFEVPSFKRKEAAIEFINEFYKYGSKINGTGGFNRFVDNYEGWLTKLENDYHQIVDEEHVPARTYFLVRKNDDRIVGMINIRLALNDKLRNYGGNIGYCIRPTERNKGYNKINLYLGLKICDQYDIDKVLLEADVKNLASWKTMEALGGIRIKECFEEISHSLTAFYEIDVKKALKEHAFYEQYID